MKEFSFFVLGAIVATVVCHRVAENKKLKMENEFLKEKLKSKEA